MVFAALLGATFITVIATNLSATARSSSKSQAQAQLRAGEIFAKLRFAEAGLNWRPKRSEKVPQPADADFLFYYDDFDRARGWSSSGVADGVNASTRNAFERDGFAKFPDPRNEAPRDGHFMLRVARVQIGDDDNAARDKTGDVRVEIVGRAADNAAVFTSQTFYLTGETRHPLTANMRTVSNWNFASGAVPSGELAAPVANAKLLTLRNPTAPFPQDGHFYITIGGPNSAAVQCALVESVIGDTLKLTAPLSANAGERVEIAAAFGAPAALDFDFDGAIDATREAVDFSLSQNVSGGVRANGGLLFDGRVLASLRGKPRADAQGLPAASLRASGVMRLFDAPSGGAVSNVKISGEYSQGSGAPQNIASAPLSMSSADASFPGKWGAMTPSEKAQLADDGWNRIRGEIIGERRVDNFTPPDIAREQGAAYRRVTKFSPPLNSSDGAGASQFGYGEGIYLDNASDVEKIGVAPDVYRAMTPGEFRDLVFDGATVSNRCYGRNDAPRLPNENGKSLEEQHLRGWIGPDEFRARGALLEIDADNARIFITRDARDDLSSGAPAQNLEPAPHKSWRRADGALAGDANLGGVYKIEFAWPKNGVIFAEGNLRVRGSASTRTVDPGRSLTVVSQGNIFIEGSLDAGARKILLLARKNVVLNPTSAVLSRVEAMTRLSTATGTSSANKTILVHDAMAFQVGDSIELVRTSSNTLDRRVTKIVNATTLELDKEVTSTSYVAGSVVRTIGDPLSQPSTGTKGVPFVGPCTHLELFSQAMQRRAVFPAGATTARLAFRHSAERKNALTISVVNDATSTSRALLSNKAAASTRDSDLRAPYKHLDIYHDSGVDVFPTPFPGNAAEAAPMFLGPVEPPSPTQTPAPYSFARKIKESRAAPNWNYSVKVENGYDVGTSTGPKQPPYYFLAAVGNRLESVGAVLPDAKNVLSPNSYSIPMATSVELSFDGSTAAMQDERWNAARGSFGLTTQFGFSAAFGDNTDLLSSREDALTVDQTFYNGAAYADNGAYTLDSRSIDVASGAHSLVLRLNNNVVNDKKTVEDYFKAPTTTKVLSDIPYYRLSRWKLENATFDAASHELDSLAPYAIDADGATIAVRAYVYAQEGSWLVIPGDFFDNDTRGAADLDRDGVISRREEVAAYRYHRYNYRIDFHGAITENRSAVIESSGAVRGSVADWTDKWATVSLNNLAAGFNPASPSSAAGNFATINYSFDDDAARGLLEGDEGFRLPMTPDGWRRG